jgi:DNA-binding transcriptional regulator YiaG
MPLSYAQRIVQYLRDKVGNPTELPGPSKYRVPSVREVRAIRLLADLSLGDTADYLGISNTTLCDIELGQQMLRLPRAKRIMRLARQSDTDSFAAGLVETPRPPMLPPLSSTGDPVPAIRRPVLSRFWIPPGDELRRLRVLADMSSVVASETVNVGSGTVRSWEREGNAPLQYVRTLVSNYAESVPAPLGVVPTTTYNVPTRDEFDALCRKTGVSVCEKKVLRSDNARRLLAKCRSEMDVQHCAAPTSNSPIASAEV